MTSKTDFPDVLRGFIDARLADIHTCLPGRIEKYDHTKQKASVKPLIKKQYRDGEVQSLPVIVNVPVVWPRSGGASLTFPVQAGDGVLLLFTERAMERWLSSGGEAVPGDPRKFDLSDAIAIPGLVPFTEGSLSENNEDVLLVHNDAKLKIDASGKLALGNSQAELLDIVDQLLQLLIDSRTATSIGLQPLTVVPQITQLRNTLNSIKGEI